MKDTSRAQVLLVAITLIVFARIAPHDFIKWDDPFTISSNPLIVQPTWHSIAYYWTHGAMGLWIPLTYTLWAGLSAISGVGGATSGPNPWIFHATSIVLHTVNALLVYRIVQRVLPSERWWPACAGALLFAVHPIQVEAVAWISGMKDLLSAIFALTSIAIHLKGSNRRDVNALTLLTFVLSMLAKPSGVVVIPMIAIIDRVLLHRDWNRIARTLAICCIVAVPITIIARTVQSTFGVPRIPIPLRPMLALDSICFYLCKIVWPFKLAPDYGRMASLVIEHRWIAWTWIVPALVAAIAWLSRHRAPPIAAGAMLFAAGLLPVLSFTPFLFQFYSTVADHYVYLPMLGIALAAAYLINQFRPRATFIASTVLIAILGTRTIVQAGYWRDSEHLFRHNLAINPRSVVSENNLGAALAEQGRYPEAMQHYEAAIEISPDYRMAHSNLAQLYALLNQPDRAIAHLERALELLDQTPVGLGPRDSTGEHLQLAIFLERTGRYDAARKHLLKVLAAQPSNIEAKQLLEKLPPATTQETAR